MYSFKWHRSSLYFLLFLGTGVHLWGQNLIPNPNFEDYVSCPLHFAFGMYLECEPWHSATMGTSDYLNSCSTPGDVGVPYNQWGFQYANSGEGYGGMWSRGNNYREYLQTALAEPLAGGTGYFVQFYVNQSNAYCAIEWMGAYFSAGPPPYVGGTPLNVTPQVESNSGFLKDTVNWILIEGCFIAEGGEDHITIGNFRNDPSTPLDPLCSGSSATYYYLDDVSVFPIIPGGIQIDLGPDVVTCYEYEIDPGITGVDHYLWNTGSTSPTLTVNSTGTYILTVYAGCEAGVDSIDVEITNQPPVDINPGEITICAGTTYTVSLDPNAGAYLWSDGSTNPSLTIDAAGTYMVTLDDGCDITNDQIILHVLDPPSPFSIGEDTVICPGTEIEYEMNPMLGDITWQNGSTMNYQIITTPGTYSVTIENMCGSQFAEVMVSQLNPPDANLGPDTEHLCVGDFIDFFVDPAMGEATWQDGSHVLVYHVTTSGLYSVTLTNACGSSSDQISVDFLETPMVDFGIDFMACPGDTFVLTADSIPGTYQWQDGSNTFTYQVTGPGLYSLMLSNDCGEDSDSILIWYEDIIDPPDLGPDFNLCTGQQITLYPGSMASSYVWQDSSIADSLVVLTPGIYAVTVFNTCVVLSDTVIIGQSDDPPQLHLPDQLTLCDGQSLTLDANISGVDFLWQDGSQGAQLLVTTPGQYMLTVSNFCGVDADTVTVTDGGPAPFVDLGNDVALCAGDVISLTPAFSDVDTWWWSDGSALPTYTITGSDTISVSVSNACGTSYDTLVASLLPATPPLDLGADTSLCPGALLQLSIPTPNVDIVWSDGSVHSGFLVNGPGSYFATISNACGSNSDTINIGLLPGAPALNLGMDQSLCPGEVILLDPGLPNVNYLWQDGSTSSSFSALQADTIILTVSTVCGSSTDTLIIVESTEGPQVNLGPDVLACEGDIVTLMSDISGVNYLWQDGSTNAVFSTDISGQFVLQVSNLCGTDTDTVDVVIDGMPPDFDLGPDTTLCTGTSLTLSSMVDSGTSLQWQDGSSNLTYVVTLPGTYILSQTNHCGILSDSILIDFLNPPEAFDLGSDTVLCPGESIVLHVPYTSSEWQWQDGSADDFIVADQALTYALQLSNACGTAYDELHIDIDHHMPVVTLDPLLVLCPGDLIVLDVTQSFPASYLWSTGSDLPAISIGGPGNYSVDVQTLCLDARGEVQVLISDSCFTSTNLFIPNAFSPNGDGINDVFSVFVNPDIDVVTMQMSIFDRWGNLIFTSDAPDVTWHGDFAGKPLNPGVFVYRLEASYRGPMGIKDIHLTGDITLLR